MKNIFFIMRGEVGQLWMKIEEGALGVLVSIPLKKKKKGVHVVIIYGNVMPTVHIHVFVHMHPRCHPLSLNPLVKTFLNGQIIKQEKRNK